MKLNQNKFFPGIAAYAFLLLCSVLFCGALPAGAQQGVDVVLTNLQSNAKLHAPDDILADFVNGEPETAVIVLIRPSTAATALAVRSQAMAQVPAEFTVPGAATYYNLQDESVRTQLRATVTETVGRVIDELGATGMKVTQRFSYQFGFSAKVTPAALERIVSSPDVVSVEKDVILYPHLAQGIPLMNASAVRGTYTGAGLSIAICDTGIDTSHPRLGGTAAFPNSKVIGGYDTGDNDADPRPGSNGGAHGTACAGIAAGSRGTVGDYIGGVAPDAKLYAVKISTDAEGTAPASSMIAGWEWCVTHKNDDPSNPILIISTSFGGGQFSATCNSESSGMTTAAANAVAAGITIFASSGNDGFCDSMGWPACISYVNSVGAVYDANFGRNPPTGYVGCISTNSCVGYTSGCSCSSGNCYVDNTTAPDKVATYSNSAPFLTLFAPSNNAYTTDIVGPGGYDAGSYDTSFGGTSAACPYAAGSAAVLQSAAKAKTGSYLTPAQVRSYLVNNGDNVTDSKAAVTKPRINLGRAVNAITGKPSTVPTPQSPSGNITDKTPTYKWTKVTGATQYRFQLVKGSTTKYTKMVGSSACGSTTCTNTPTTVLGYSAYKWKVQAKVGGVWKAYSAFMAFTVTAPSTGPKAGFWESETGDEFYVTTDKKNVDDFAIYVRVDECGKTYKITRTAPASIVNKKFSFSGAFYASGTFDTTTSAHGTDGLDKYNISGCGSVSGGPWNWTATWTDSSQPSIVVEGTATAVIDMPEEQGPFRHAILTTEP